MNSARLRPYLLAYIVAGVVGVRGVTFWPLCAAPLASNLVYATFIGGSALLGWVLLRRLNAEAAVAHAAMQAKLRERDAQLALFVEHSPAAIAMFDRDMRYLVVNRRWLSDFDLTEESVIGRSYYDVSPDVPARCRELHRRCLAGAVERSEADPLPRASRPTDWVRWELRPWRAADGSIGGLVLFSEVVTDRVHAEEAVRRSEEQFRALFEGASVGMAQADVVTRRLLRVNRRLCEMTGYSEAELLSMSFLDLTHPDDWHATEEEREGVVAGTLRAYRVEKRYLRKDGDVVWVNVNATAMQDGEGRIVALQATIEDVTERVRARDALRQSEEQFRALFEGASIGMAQADLATGRFVRANRSLCAMLGYTEDELRERTVSDVTHPNDRDLTAAGRASMRAGTASAYRVEKRYVRKDGGLVWVNVNVNATHGADGKVTSIQASIEDVTERRSMQERSIEAQKMEAVGQLAGGVAHDFNNILMSILMQVELGVSDGRPEEMREALVQVRADAGRATELTRQLLLFGRRQAMQSRDIDVGAVVRELGKMLHRLIRADVKVAFDLAPEPLFAHVDRGMIEQVVMNLAVNARDAMVGGGVLTIRTRGGVVDAALAEAHPELTFGARYVSLEMSDTGGGIPPEVLPHVFEPFFTTKEAGHGTGLGLATVFGIVQQHRGWIEVATEVGRGTTFRVVLPAVSQERQVAEPAVRAAVRGGGEVILLVEDEPAVRRVTERVLTRSGYRVFSAATGPEAILVWKEHGAEIALLLTDLMMPGGMDGHALADALLADRPELRVVFASGYSEGIAGRDVPLRPTDRYLQKPAGPNDLLAAVRASLDA